MKLSHESWRSGLQFKRMNNYKRILVASCWKFFFEMMSDLAVCAWGCSARIMWCWCGELQFCKKLRELRSIDSGDRWLLTESIGKIQSLGVFSELLAGCGSRPAVNSYCLGSTREGADAVTRQHWISSEEGLECRDIHFALKGKSRDLLALNRLQ